MYRAGNVAGFIVVVTVFCSSAVPSVTVILDNVVHRDAMANDLKSKRHTEMAGGFRPRSTKKAGTRA